jgi:predicted transcriptional regulator
LFYECKSHIYFVVGGNAMAGAIVEVTDSRSQLQVTPVDYAGTVLIKLKRNNGWNWKEGSKRGRLEIMADILLFCGQQQGKTSIMYQTNLNYALLKRHLKYLMSHGLLSRDTKKYVTTEKGHRFLEIFAQLNDLLKKR